jgi:hypothetical protein
MSTVPSYPFVARFSESANRHLVLPNSLLVGEFGSFANKTMKIRHSETTARVKREHPTIDPALIIALDDLTEEIQSNAMLKPLKYKDPEQERAWMASHTHRGDRCWNDVSFLEAECYYFTRMHHLFLAFGIKDVFAPHKQQQLTASLSFAQSLAEVHWNNLLEASGSESFNEDQLRYYCMMSMWGNAADMCFHIHQKDTQQSVNHLTAMSHTRHPLLVDELDAFCAYMQTLGASDQDNIVIDMVLDNCGEELAADLLFCDYLWQAAPRSQQGKRRKIVLHVKSTPTHVSDVMSRDIYNTLHYWMAAGSAKGASQPLSRCAHRLATLLSYHDVEIKPSHFWNGPQALWEAPPELLDHFKSSSSLLILKGDLNYRRLVGDYAWPASCPLQAVTAYLSTPHLVLRTLKSWAVLGVPIEVEAKLSHEDTHWRTNGTKAVAHFVQPIQSESVGEGRGDGDEGKGRSSGSGDG